MHLYWRSEYQERLLVVDVESGVNWKIVGDKVLVSFLEDHLHQDVFGVQQNT